MSCYTYKLADLVGRHEKQTKNIIIFLVPFTKARALLLTLSIGKCERNIEGGQGRGCTAAFFSASFFLLSARGVTVPFFLTLHFFFPSLSLSLQLVVLVLSESFEGLIG